MDGKLWVDAAVFTAPADAPVEVCCSVGLSPLDTGDERVYWFIVADEDLDKLPWRWYPHLFH